ncbi:regulator of cell cycle RGCC isoform X1 [Betta splendens]|uniref:Regulator of cell cycle RGCC isoform X1 n=1 Tax=Betta splendens TaxID=158456 RepID=A0A9W2XH36_BETSP|nr:regulator of cell cycle RGCC isoform X1 [Betta splendens]
MFTNFTGDVTFVTRAHTPLLAPPPRLKMRLSAAQSVSWTRRERFEAVAGIMKSPKLEPQTRFVNEDLKDALCEFDAVMEDFTSPVEKRRFRHQTPAAPTDQIRFHGRKLPGSGGGGAAVCGPMLRREGSDSRRSPVSPCSRRRRPSHAPFCRVAQQKQLQLQRGAAQLAHHLLAAPHVTKTQTGRHQGAGGLHR